jgi:hypothetical protein
MGKDDVVKKWSEEAPKRSTYYETEASKAGTTWETNATAAAGTYKTAVQATGIDLRFKGGVKKVGGAKFERKVKDVGVSRFGPGISAAKTDYDTGVAPFLSALATIEVPARGPRGDPNNYNIVAKVGDPLHKLRLAQLGAGT